MQGQQEKQQNNKTEWHVYLKRRHSDPTSDRGDGHKKENAQTKSVTRLSCAKKRRPIPHVYFRKRTPAPRPVYAPSFTPRFGNRAKFLKKKEQIRSATEPECNQLPEDSCFSKCATENKNADRNCPSAQVCRGCNCEHNRRLVCRVGWHGLSG